MPGPPQAALPAPTLSTSRANKSCSGREDKAGQTTPRPWGDPAPTRNAEGTPRRVLSPHGGSKPHWAEELAVPGRETTRLLFLTCSSQEEDEGSSGAQLAIALPNDARAPVGDDHPVGCHEMPSLGHLAAWEKPQVPATRHPCTAVLPERTDHVQHDADLSSSRTQALVGFASSPVLSPVWSRLPCFSA